MKSLEEGDVSQEKGMVSKDFSEEKELEQMLQGRVKVRQGEKRAGDSRSVTVISPWAQGPGHSQHGWTQEGSENEPTNTGHATHPVSCRASAQATPHLSAHEHLCISSIRHVPDS